METYVEKLNKVTFSVHHSPNCASPFQVRLIGKSEDRLDNILDNSKTKDILGFGSSFEEAAQAAWRKKFGNN
ncbi:MAG: hypothetical protein A2Z52_00555 [Candidatus Moranbacteria bacterium RBG_19FT_COMBO_42_6]|nr:MAG: hypothetical protein A2Z52_00555 [Candidatus Moranbacteria bacterium RBG_19FT_COMBO_42_6]